MTGTSSTDSSSGGGPHRYAFDAASVDEGSSHGIMLSLVGRSRDVLDVGCATGDLARALRARDCRVSGFERDADAAEVARPQLDSLVVGDLETTDLTSAFPDESFDVVVLGDVLEHLREPLTTLRQVRGLLRAGGSIVLSVPNVAHASVRLSLLCGRFEYQKLGLLDETHLRFFTRDSILRLLDQAGFVPVDVRRTVLGPFDAEIPLDEEQLPREALDFVMSDPESITYQFVVEAVADDAGGRARARQAALRRLEHELSEAQAQASRHASELAALHAQLNNERTERAALASRLRVALADLEQSRQQLLELHEEFAAARAAAGAAAVVDDLRLQLEAARSEATHARLTLDAVYRSTAWRVSAPVRALGPVRRAIQGPLGSRRSLLRRGVVTDTLASLHSDGLATTVTKVRRELGSPGHQRNYAEWLERNGTLSKRDVAAIRRHIAEELGEGPVISVVMPVYDTGAEVLRAAFDSVRNQLYPHWELCIADDASSAQETLDVLAQLAGDPRVHVRRRESTGGIATATNEALRLATGDFVAFMDHDDVLAPHALYVIAHEAATHPDTAVVYTDEDKIDRAGQRYDPHFKPDFDPELLLGQNYLSHLTVMRRSLVEQLGALNEQLDGAQDHDLVLRAVEVVPHEQIRHVPHVLYHWRQWSGSGTFSGRRLVVAASASRAAVTAHLRRQGQAVAEVVPAPAQPGWNRVVRHPPHPLPEITAVIPTRDRLSLLQPCVEGLLQRTDYGPLKVLVVDNDSSDPETLEYLREIGEDSRVRVLHHPGDFNYAAINNWAVRQVDTPLLLLLNNDILVRTEDWLQEMVSLLAVPGTGCVGAKLLYADGRVQHAGVILGIGGVAGHSHKYSSGASAGYFGRLILNHSVSAVTGACLLMPTELYLEVGGLDERNLAVAFNDVDLCLRIRDTGARITYAAYAVLNHLESASRGAEHTPQQVRRFNSEADWMKQRWGIRLAEDPAYNPNLSDVHEDFSLAHSSRASRPWSRYLS